MCVSQVVESVECGAPQPHYDDAPAGPGAAFRVAISYSKPTPFSKV